MVAKGNSIVIPNFSVVRDGLVFRGAQPGDGDWADIQALGVRHVLKLNEVSEGADHTPEGFELFCFPISLLQQVAPMPVDVTAPLVYLCNPTHWPIYFHCTHGQDRTGLLAAQFRVAMDGWDVGRAQDEMLNYGFHPELLGLWLGWEMFKRSRGVIVTPR